MKNQIVAAFKKKRIVIAFKNQLVVAFIMGGAIIIAPAIFIVALIRLAYMRGIGAALARPVSEKIRRLAEGSVTVSRNVGAVEKPKLHSHK